MSKRKMNRLPANAHRSRSPSLQRRRLWDDTDDEDPLSATANLFDIALVFTIALAIALFSRPEAAAPYSQTSKTASSNASAVTPDLEQAAKLLRYRVSTETASGDGTRLGTAYRLKNGDVVYVPEQ